MRCAPSRQCSGLTPVRRLHPLPTGALARKLVGHTGATEWDLALTHVRSALLAPKDRQAPGHNRPVYDDFAAVKFMVSVWLRLQWCPRVLGCRMRNADPRTAWQLQCNRASSRRLGSRRP